MEIHKNPYAVLLSQLSGVSPAPARARQGWQQLMKENYPDVIAPAVAAAWAVRVEQGLQKTDRNDAAFRADVARGAFNTLSKDRQKELLANAKRDKEEMVATYKQALEDHQAGCRAPEKRQECVLPSPVLLFR